MGQDESLKGSNPEHGTMLIRGEDVPVFTINMEHAKLRYYPENPRVYSALHGDGKTPDQEEIQLRLQQLEHVKELTIDIRRNGGLLEPLIVKNNTFEVLEGNSRLAAYRSLAKGDPVKWGHVKCTILPNDIDQSLIFALLGQLHIKGKKDWVPYEQAGFLYRRFKHNNGDVKALALEIGITSQRVKHLVDVYEFMIQMNENDVNRWSYYDEYLKSGVIRKARLAHPELDDMIVEKICTGEIARAVDLRDDLPVICATPKALNKFLARSCDFDESYELAASHGGDTAYVKTAKRFRQWITDPDTATRILESEGKVRSTVKFELEKIETKARFLLKKMQP